MCNTDGPDWGGGPGGREAGGKRREAGEGGGRREWTTLKASVPWIDLPFERQPYTFAVTHETILVFNPTRCTGCSLLLTLHKTSKTNQNLFLQRYFCQHAPTGLSAARLNHQPAQRGAAAGLGGQIGYYHRWLSGFVSHSLLAWPQPAIRNSNLIIHSNRHRRRNRP
jgi:hypothetical protein